MSSGTANVVMKLTVLATFLIGLPVVAWQNREWLTDLTQNEKLPRSVIKHDDSADPRGVSTFTLKLSGLTASTEVFLIAQDMAKIAQNEVGHDRTEGTVVFDVVGDGEDRYGKSTEVDAFTLSYSMDDLRQVNWSNFDGMKLLNLATIVDQYPAGRRLISQYCLDNSESSEGFCTTAAAR